MNALARTTASLIALTVAILVANLPALAERRTITFRNESQREVNVIVDALGTKGLFDAVLWRGNLDRAQGSLYPNSVIVRIEDAGKPFRIVFSSPECKRSEIKTIEQHQTAQVVTFANCTITVP